MRPHPTGQASPDANESIAGNTAVSYDKLWHLAVSGAINDSFTMAAVLRLRPHFNDGRFEIDKTYVHKYSAFEFANVWGEKKGR